jgi:dienelactone hydrolase
MTTLFSRWWRRALPVLALAPGVFAAEAPPPIPLKDFFGLPNVRAPKLSPDGKKIAFLFPHEQRLALGLFDRETKESRMILRGEDESLWLFFWKGNDRIVFEADVAGNESFFIGATDLTGRNIRRLAESQRLEDNLTGTFGLLVSPLPADPDRIMLAGLAADNADDALYLGGEFSVARVNIRNKARSPLYDFKPSDRLAPLGNGLALVADHAGALRIKGRLDGRQLVWEHRLDDGHEFREIARHPFHGYREQWQPLFFAKDNVTLYLISREEHDRGALYTLNTRTLQRSPALFVPPEGEIDDPLAREPSAAVMLNDEGDKLLGVAYTSDRLHYRWFDAEREALQQKLEATFRGCEVRITSTADDGKVMLVHVTHDREPGAYFLLDQKAGSLTLFKRVRDLDPARLRPMEQVTYRARDGLEIHALLTRPAGAEPPSPGSGAPRGRRVPLIIHPHGGPFGIRDYWGFNNEVQFLASRGYAVLQPNYRGSGGYGRAFLDRGKQQWGRAMQDDLTDAVQWAVAQGLADPARVAIYGASYGGYAALAGVTLTPELYCCGVNYVGAADLDITFKNRGDDAWTRAGEFSYQTEWVGPTAEYRAATSPVNFVERIRVPTLHAYGEKDPRVKIDHWTRLEPQLRKFGKPYEVIEEKKQGHGFRDERASLKFYERLEKFFADYLAPEGRVKVGDTKVIEMPAKR